jgi:hypothetical protein
MAAEAGHLLPQTSANGSTDMAREMSQNFAHLPLFPRIAQTRQTAQIRLQGNNPARRDRTQIRAMATQTLRGRERTGKNQN